MSLLPISQSDLQLCAERWGWQRTSAPSVIHRTLSGVHLLAEADDMINAAAILDRESWLITNRFSLLIDTLYGYAFVNSNSENAHGDRGLVKIKFTPEHVVAPNFRSWLLVQLTLKLPPEVWK